MWNAKWSTNRQKWNTEDLHMLLHRTVQFFSPRPAPFTTEYQPRLMRSPTDHDVRSQENQREMKNNKAPGIDILTSDVMILGGEESVTQKTKSFNHMLETKKILVEWKEAKMIILHKKGEMNFRPVSLLSHVYRLFTQTLQKWMEKVLDENQLREQAGFRKGYLTVDHLQMINQLIEKCHEFKRPLCIGYFD